MPDWLKSALQWAIGPVRDAVTALTARLTSIWQVATGFFSLCRTAFTRLRSKVQGWISAQWQHAVQVFTTLKWIITTYVPRIGAKIAGEVRTWASNLIGGVAQWARTTFDSVIRWTSNLVGTVANRLASFVSWVLDQIGNLVADVRRLVTQVFGVLGTPERLAIWAGEAIAHWVLKFVVDHLEAITRYLWARRAALFVRFTDMTEEIISHLL